MKPQIIRLLILLCCYLFGTHYVNAKESAKLSYDGPVPKYIFLFIGDGMSFPQVATMGVYRGTVAKNFKGTLKNPTPHTPPKADNPNFTTFPVIGVATTYDASKFITDSAAAATAIATGYKTLDGRVGMDPFNKKVPSIATLLKTQKQYKIGIISSVSIDHATPAGFYAQQDFRSNYYEIALDLLNSEFDFFGGGGFKRPKGNDGQQPDIHELATQRGYQLVTTQEGLKQLTPGVEKVIAINPVLDNRSDMAMKFSIDANPRDLTLTDFTRKGIELLEESPTGFFMMVEGGKIDWAAHANDALSMIKDVEALEDAVAVALEFYQRHSDETLILVTGDHETGGLSMGFGGTEYDTFFNLLSQQTLSYQAYEEIIREYRNNGINFEKMLADLEPYYGLLLPDNPKAKQFPQRILNARELEQLKTAYQLSMLPLDRRVRDLDYRIIYTYDTYEPLQITVTHILNNKAGIGWSSSAHTGLPVAVYARGVGQELFNGLYENTGIFDRLKALTYLQ